ncbi:unnamed protein product [Symbiodinium sp. CCMP2456]|nr:unnamed protein product [Symbiodinium sp. CCMP2456]
MRPLPAGPREGLLVFAFRLEARVFALEEEDRWSQSLPGFLRGVQLSQVSASAPSSASDGSCSTRPGGPNSVFRTEVAENVGHFLRRALDGAYRGSSGRDQLSVASRYYIVLADFEGRQFAEPCVFSTFSRAKALCIRGPDKGQSIFVGLPSQTEEAVIPGSTPAFQRLRDYILEGPEVSCQIVVVGEFEGQFLVAVPQGSCIFRRGFQDLAEEGGSEMQDGAGDQGWEQRLRVLELGMRQLQTSMQTLVDGVPLSREELAEVPPEPAPAAGVGAFQGAPPGLSRPPRLAGLDPGVVDAARAAGIPENQLAKMSQMATAGRGRLGGRAKAAPRRAADPLDESDEEVVAAAGDGEALASGSQVTQAMIQISKVLKAMHSEREKRNDLEELLDRADGGGDALGGPGASGRSKTAAFHKLRGILRNSPELISASIEGLISEDFSLAQSGPSLEDRKCTVRGWVEHRSHLQQFAGPIRNAWTLATIVDQLNNAQPEAAKATALLAIASLDQAAIDQGNWLLASEFAMQPSPPFSAFQRPRSLDPLEARQTKIIDSRWISVFMSRLKERDAFHTAKKNLSSQGSSVPPGNTSGGDAAGGSGDPARKPPRKPPKGGGKGGEKEK